MSNAELIYAAVVVIVGLPALRWNWTAAALVLVYAFMQGSYYGLGVVYPPAIGFLADLTVIAMIYAKQPACDFLPYADWKAQLAACWFERSVWDRIIVALFPVGWCFYAFSTDPYWPLYWISLAQLLAAGFEAFETFKSTRSAKAVSVPDPPSSGFLYSPGRRSRGYG